MDSGNSGGGSAQSSSGGADEEFDSSRPLQGDHQHHSVISPSLFTPPINFGSPNPLFLNPNFSDDHPVWPAGSGPIRTQSQNQTYANFGSLSQHPPPRVDPDHHHPHGLSAVAKNPKKRTRASRRAPTTVLTTDASNFRQMVQEFTGIPPSPFAAPSSRRLDLFSAPGSLRLGPLDSLGPLYSLRPPISPNTTAFLMNSSSAIESTINPNSAIGPPFPSNSYFLPLQLGGSIPPLGGFPNQESAGSRNNNDDGDRGELGERGWGRGNDGNVGDAGGYDGNVDSTRHDHHQQQQQQQRHVSDYNLNLSEKAVRENDAAGAPPPAQGNAASWMYPSQ